MVMIQPYGSLVQSNSLNLIDHWIMKKLPFPGFHHQRENVAIVSMLKKVNEIPHWVTKAKRNHRLHCITYEVKSGDAN